MGISSLRAWILAASLLSVSAVAHAAGLGRINVTSPLGAPLKAEVELVAEKKEIPSLAVRMASPEAFARAGLTFTNALADIKVSLEKRGDGEPYVQLTSTQSISEPFLDLMLELSWSSGRVTRQFTALLDPPSLIAEREKQKAAEAQVKAAPPAPVEPKPEPVPEAKPAPATEQATPTQPSDVPQATETPAAATAAPEPVPSAPVETIGGTEPTLLGAGSSMPASTTGADAYGPVQAGDTLGKIARGNKPADVSLDQMLVLLFRANPDAFSGRNMNRLKTGKIIQLPTAEEYASVSAIDARREVLAQARDWNEYRGQVATAAGQADATAEPAQQSASGKVAPTVEDTSAQGKEAPKEVLKLSKNESATSSAAAGDPKAAGRVRALEEELVARDKAVKDANDRVAKLEKTIQDLQHLLEIKNKGMADLQKPAAPVTGQPAPAQPAVPVAPPAAKPATPAAPTPTTPAPANETAPPSVQQAPQPPKPASPKPAAPPAPEPNLMDRVMEQPAYLGAGVVALILIGALAVRAVKRRRESKADSDDSGPAIVAAAPAAASTYGGGADSASASAASDSDEVDPVKEAEIFLAYGRDAQAEELLKEALAANPGRQEVRVLLLQIYAKRKDAKSFEQVAREVQQATGSSGSFWDQAVALGYQVDPSNPRYAAGQGSGGLVAAAAGSAAAAAENVDFNIGTEDGSSTATDIDLGDSGSSLDKTQVIDLSAGPSRDDTTVMEAPAAPDIAFNVDLPAAEPEPEPARASSGLDFDIDLNSFNAPSSSQTAEVEPTASGGLDFDMSGLSLDAPGSSGPGIKAPSAAAPEFDLSGISLDLGETTPRISPSGKDDHWYDVQTKFDLAKAYQEMGDKDGARDILKEVVQEGDAEQRAAAQAVLSSIDA